MQTPKRMVVKSENLLVDVIDVIEVAGIKRYRVRDAKDKKAPVRTVLDFGLREVQEADQDYIVYLYHDEETGEAHTLTLPKEFVGAVTTYIKPGSGAAITTRAILQSMDKVDTDSNRRCFRAAVSYWIDNGILICSTPRGYFIASSHSDVESCVANKERQAHANLSRAALLRSMDVEKSIARYNQETKAA